MLKKSTGFTLIEIIIVIFIISIMSLAATLNYSNYGAGRDVDNESNRLLQLINLTSQTAMLEQSDLGIGLWRNGYNVWRYDPSEKKWNVIKNDRAFTEHILTRNLHLELRMNKSSQIVPPSGETLTHPQIWFSSSGGATPSTIMIKSEHITDSVEIANNGKIEVKREE